MGGAASSVQLNTNAPIVKRNDVLGLLKMRLVLSDGSAATLGSRLKLQTKDAEFEHLIPWVFDQSRFLSAPHCVAKGFLNGRRCPPELLVYLPVSYYEECEAQAAEANRARESRAAEKQKTLHSKDVAYLS